MTVYKYMRYCKLVKLHFKIYEQTFVHQWQKRYSHEYTNKKRIILVQKNCINALIYYSNGETFDISSGTVGSSSKQTIDYTYIYSVFPVTGGAVTTTHSGKYGSSTKYISYSNAITGAH